MLLGFGISLRPCFSVSLSRVLAQNRVYRPFNHHFLVLWQPRLLSTTVNNPKSWIRHPSPHKVALQAWSASLQRKIPPPPHRSIDDKSSGTVQVPNVPPRRQHVCHTRRLAGLFWCCFWLEGVDRLVSRRTGGRKGPTSLSSAARVSHAPLLRRGSEG